MNMAQRLILFSPLALQPRLSNSEVKRMATAAQLAPRPYRPAPVARRIEANITKRRR
jgi:hypothetical protein